MSDFDFDELDKAVNSLNKTSSNQMQNHENGSNQVMSNNDRPIPSLATKRTPGPFMDVIHPSSNMMKNPNQSTRINGSVVNPILNTQNNEIAKSEPIKEEPASDNQETKTEVIPSNDEDDDINKISEDINKTLGLTTESPFIADARVEKRPLGAFSGESNGDNSNVDVKKPDEALPIVDDAPMPAELDNDLLSIEANSVAKSTVPEETEQASATEAIQTETPQNEQEKSDNINKNIAPVVTIPQQYTEKTSPKTETSQIYENNETYKQTLMPAKKNTGWLWVIWIILLILVGAGVGAAVYFFVLEP